MLCPLCFQNTTGNPYENLQQIVELQKKLDPKDIQAATTLATLHYSKKRKRKHLRTTRKKRKTYIKKPIYLRIPAKDGRYYCPFIFANKKRCACSYTTDASLARHMRNKDHVPDKDWKYFSSK